MWGKGGRGWEQGAGGPSWVGSSFLLPFLSLSVYFWISWWDGSSPGENIGDLEIFPRGGEGREFGCTFFTI